MMKKKPADIEAAEIDPAKWTEFEATLKQALKMPPKPHKPVKPRKSKTK